MVEHIWEEPDIYRIRLEVPWNPLKNLNIYILKSAGEFLVIDTGFNRQECREALWAGIRELKLDMSRTVLFLTHYHEDHIGLVWDFVERGIPVYMGDKEYTYYSKRTPKEITEDINAIFEYEGFPKEMLNEADGESWFHMPKPGFPVTVMKSGQEFRIGDCRVIVIGTPGHTPGNSVLYLPDHELLFSGDHILFDITPNISIWPQMSHPLADYLESLQKIRGLRILTAFPAHREMGENIYGRIDEIVQHHKGRLDEICQTAAAHPGITAYEIAKSIHWSLRNLTWDDFPYNQKWFAMSESLAHIDYLVDKGQLIRETRGDSVNCYRSKDEQKTP